MTQLLRDVIHVLTKPHLRRTTNTEGETIYGEEPALLDILEDCVGNSGSGESAAAGGRAAPLSLEAVSIAQDIEYTTRAHWPVHGLLKAPLRLRVNAWYANTHQPHEALTMLDVASRWEAQIRELIEPTKKIPLRGVTCPICGYAETMTEQDGQRTYKPILMAYPHPTDTKVICTSEECSGEWAGKKIAETFKTGLQV